MKKLEKYARKSYAMRRMILAIERAIEGPTSKEKERAARWVAAWGLLCGIQTQGVNLKASDIQTLEQLIGQAGDATFTLALDGLDGAVDAQSSPDKAARFPLAAHAAADTPARPSP